MSDGKEGKLLSTFPARIDETAPFNSPDTGGSQRQRLSRSGPDRMVSYFISAWSACWLFGFWRIRKLSAHRFLAENSHRLPTSDAGWYLYHRAKNYRTVWDGAKGGVKFGFVGGGYAFFYGFIEEMWDQDVHHGKVDAIGPMVAGTATAGLFALFGRMPMRPTFRCLRAGAALGLASGVLQDLVTLGLGETPWYVKSLLKRIKKGEIENPGP